MEEENTFIVPPPGSNSVSIDYESVEHPSVVYWVKTNGNVVHVGYEYDISLSAIRRSMSKFFPECTIHVCNSDGAKLGLLSIP